MKLAYPSRKNSLLRSAVVPDEAVSRTGRVASHGLTLMEVLVATGLGSLMAAIIFTLTLYGERSFAVMANCADLDSKSRNALDVMSREIRQATQVTAVVTNFPLKWLTLTNADRGSKLTLTWDA